MRRASLIALALSLPATALALPMEFVHQGRLFDQLGDPLIGPHNLSMALYDAPSGGSLLWTEMDALTFDEGYYATTLGDFSALDIDDLDRDDLYLEIAVDGGAPVPTRLKVQAVPYAMLAERAKNLAPGAVIDASEIRINGGTVIDGSGDLVSGGDWSNLGGIPADFSDDIDNDALGALICADGDVAMMNAGDWDCVAMGVHVHAAGDITSGTMDIARLPTGSGSSEVAIGDHGHDASALTSGTIDSARLSFGTGPTNVASGDHGHDASALTSGTIDAARLSFGSGAGTVAEGNHVHDATSLTTGTVDVARLPVGAASGQVSAGDHVHDAAVLTTGTVGLARLPVGSSALDVAAGDHNHDGDYAAAGPSGTLALTPTSSPPTCDASAKGLMYYDDTDDGFRGCDGSVWVLFAGGEIGTAAHPGFSCKDIHAQDPALPDGVYYINPTGGGSIQVNCEMDRDGGGWTQGLKTWHGDSIGGNTAAVGSVVDGLLLEGNNYKISDANIQAIVQSSSNNYDMMMDQIGVNTAYSTGAYEYTIMRNWTGAWTFASAMPESTTTTTLQSYRVSDDALAWTGRLGCGNAGWGVNCSAHQAGPNPQGGAGCSINMGTASNPGWHHWEMERNNGDTYIYLCNGPQHSSGFTMNHRVWFRER